MVLKEQFLTIEPKEEVKPWRHYENAIRYSRYRKIQDSILWDFVQQKRYNIR